MRRDGPKRSKRWRHELLAKEPEFLTVSEIEMILQEGVNLLINSTDFDIDPERDRAFIQDCSDWLQKHYGVRILADFNYEDNNTPSSYVAGETPTMYITNFTAAGLTRECVHEICHFLVSSQEERRIDNYNLSSIRDTSYFQKTLKKEQRTALLNLLLTIESGQPIENTSSLFPPVATDPTDTIGRYRAIMLRSSGNAQMPRDFAGKPEFLALLKTYDYIFIG